MNDSQCSIFHELSQNVEYHIIVTVKGLLCSAGAIGIARQWHYYGVRFLVHEHTKIIFRFFYALNIMLSSIISFMYLVEPIRLRFDCLLLDFRYILLTRCVGISLIHAAQHVLLVLSVERIFSATYPAYFERHSNKPFAFSIAVLTVRSTKSLRKVFKIQIAASCTYNMLELSDNFRLFREQRLQRLLTNVALSNCVSLILLFVDLYLNFVRKSATIESLGVSYQRTENRRIILTLLPIELTQMFFIFFTNISLVIYGKVSSNPRPINQQIFLELVTPTTFVPLILTFVIKRSIEKQ
ncbi:hypothetical protein PENTCL1PPCAC_14288, partial [Pristionchus entomophagus]